MPSNHGPWDAVVVGSGLGGLTCAAYLATNGVRPLVLEKHYVAGGNAHVFRRKQLFEFDVGVHYIGDCNPGGAIPNVLRGIGLEGKIEFLEMDPDGFDTLVYPGLTFCVPKGWDRYRERLIDCFPDDETALHRCLDTLEAVIREFQAVRLPVAPEDVPQLMREAPAFMRWGMRPLLALFDECGVGQKARAVIAAQSGTYALPPSRAPVLLHAMILDHYLKGAFYPRGGGQVIPAHLVDVVRANGGEVRTRAPVKRILMEEGRAAGVVLANGQEIRAPVVVSNADLKRTYLEMIGPQHLPPSLTQKVEAYRMALPLLCVYLGLDIDLRDAMPVTNYLLFDSFDVEGPYEDCSAGRLPSELSLYITAGSVKDPDTERIAPKGYTSLELMTLVPAEHAFWGLEKSPALGERYHSNRRYQEMKERLTEAMIDGAARLFPDLRDHIVWQEAATPMSHEHFTFSSGGTSYGIDMAPDQFGPARPLPATEIPGLFLAGASTVFGHGVAGTMLGGVGTASAILQRDLYREVESGRVFGDPGRLRAGGPGWDPWQASR